ncbi:hypothetical protein PsyrCH409_08830 [Pseudomonas viridiflava]|nr:hypothetical protein PsyrCH409_08830 [Pseudomonas viridiflava]
MRGVSIRREIKLAGHERIYDSIKAELTQNVGARPLMYASNRYANLDGVSASSFLEQTMG